MLKKTITFKDFHDKEITHDFYFNLTKAEIIEMELTAVGNSLVEHLKGVIASENGQLIMDTFKSIIFKAYGEKSDDGMYFKKSDQASLNFSYTGAYDKLYVELITDAEKSAEFINGLMPKELQDKVATMTARERSEAGLSGFNKKQAPEKSTVEVVPEIPAGEPVLAPYNEHVANSNSEIASLPDHLQPAVKVDDFASMSAEELRAMVQANPSAFKRNTN